MGHEIHMKDGRKKVQQEYTDGQLDEWDAKDTIEGWKDEQIGG